MPTVLVEQELAKPVDRVFAYLSEHEHLAQLFGAKVSRLKDGDDGHRNGVGSVRKLQIAVLPPFEETVTKFVPDELIEYRITKGGQIKDHRGEMRFEPTPSGGTRLRYQIDFNGKVPGTGGLIAKQLDGNIRKGLAKCEPAM